VLAGEGAVLFLERIAPAIESVDSSSGGIGTAVNNAVRDLAAILATAPADLVQRERWLERLFTAFEEDRMPYLKELGDEWGRICASPEVASHWADRQLGATRRFFREERNQRAYMKEAVICLSALHAAGRHDEVVELLENERFWPFQRWAVKALASVGRTEEALGVVDEIDGNGGYDLDAYRLGEEILLAADRAAEAYRRYGLRAVSAGTNLAYFRAVARKYPHKPPAEILADLVARSPGSEGQWFSAAKSLGLYGDAIALVQRSPCDPKTLTRAARDFAEQEPEFALEAGIAALRWIAEGKGYEIDTPVVHQAFEHTMKAAASAGREGEPSLQVDSHVRHTREERRPSLELARAADRPIGHALRGPVVPDHVGDLEGRAGLGQGTVDLGPLRGCGRGVDVDQRAVFLGLGVRPLEELGLVERRLDRLGLIGGRRPGNNQRGLARNRHLVTVDPDRVRRQRALDLRQLHLHAGLARERDRAVVRSRGDAREQHLLGIRELLLASRAVTGLGELGLAAGALVKVDGELLERALDLGDVLLGQALNGQDQIHARSRLLDGLHRGRGSGDGFDVLLVAAFRLGGGEATDCRHGQRDARDSRVFH
jgi:hypothetical protein